MEEPKLQISILPNGAQLVVPVGPGTAILVALSSDMLDELCKQWKDNKRRQQTNMAVIRDINSSKIH